MNSYKKCLSILILLLLVEQFPKVVSQTVLESKPVTNWGVWGTFDNCTAGTFVQAFQLKTEAYQGSGDDTALNGIRFYCGVRNSGSYTSVITSTEGGWGTWGSVFSCGFGRGDIYGFQLNVEPYRESGDDTATNNLRVFCSNDNNPANDFVQGDGQNFGLWSPTEDIRRCLPGQAFCGLQTQVEVYQGDGNSIYI